MLETSLQASPILAIDREQATMLHPIEAKASKAASPTPLLAAVTKPLHVNVETPRLQVDMKHIYLYSLLHISHTGVGLLTTVYVIKRDGSREEFAYEKIVVSCLKAGAPLDVARKIAKIVEARILESGSKEVTAKDLTRMVLELLKKENEEWYRNWIIFDRAVKRRKTEEELR